MANLETLKTRALNRLTKAIKYTLNPGDESNALPGQSDVPLQAETPHVDLNRHFAIVRLWEARKILDSLDAELITARGSLTEEERQKLQTINEELFYNEYHSASANLAQARQKSPSAEMARRLESAQSELARAKYNLRLMASPFLRVLASGWFIICVFFTVLLSAGILYYVLYGADAALPPEMQSAPLAQKTAQNIQSLNLTGVISNIDNFTRFLEALEKMFNVIKALIAAVLATFAVITVPRLGAK